MSKKYTKQMVPIAVIGTLVPIISSNLAHVFGIWDSPWGGLIIAFLYISAGIYIWEGTFKGSLKPLFIILLFIPVGVFIDVIIDGFVRHFDRNLFPLEIVYLWLIAPVLLFIGMGLRKLYLHKKNNEGQPPNNN